MTSKQVTANRKNAKRSTGAKTKEGKEIVSLNSVKHGVTSQAVILPNENKDEYQLLIDGIKDDFEAKTATEEILIEKMAQAVWKKRRLARYEETLSEANEKYIKAEYKNSKWTMSMSASLEQHKFDLVEARSPMGNENIRRYETMLDRQFFKALEELQKLQVFLAVKKRSG